MRTHGSFQYGDDSEKKLLNMLGSTPKSTRAIAQEARIKLFPKISRATVARMLNSLKDKGKIKGARHGKSFLWWKS